MTREADNSLLNYSQVSERILSVELGTATESLTIFRVYAPDSSYNETNSNMFYNQL